MWVWKQWTDEHQTTRKTSSGRRKATAARDCFAWRWMTITSSRKLAARWSSATGKLMPDSSIRRNLLYRELHARLPLYRISLTANHRSLCLQWAYEHRTWWDDWHHILKKIWISLPPADIQNLFHSMLRCIAAVIAQNTDFEQILLLSSIYIRRKHWIRENFRLPVFDGFTCFEMSWTRFDHF